MTRTGRAFALVTVALYLVAVANDRDLSYLMCWTTASLLVASFLLSRMSLSGVEVSAVDFTDRAFEGHNVLLTLRFRNVGSLNKSNLLIELELTNETQETTTSDRWHLPCLEAGSEVEEHLAIVDLRRGVIPVRTARLTSGDPLGFFVCHRTVPLDHRLTIYPQRLALPEPPTVLGGGDERSSALEAPTGRGEDEFHAVRPYVDGDDLRRVHWPTTARTGRLSVKEFEGAARRDALLLVDLWHGQEGEPGEPEAFENTLKVAAAIAEELLRGSGGLAVHLTGARPVRVPLDRGERQFVRALEAFARARADGPLPLDRSLMQTMSSLPLVGTAVVVTASLPPGLPQAVSAIRARQVSLLVAHALPPDAVPTDHDSSANRDLVRMVQAAGATVWPVTVRPRHEAVHGYEAGHASVSVAGPRSTAPVVA